MALLLPRPDVYAKDKQGRIALMYFFDAGNNAMVEKLLDRGAKMERTLQREWNNGWFGGWNRRYEQGGSGRTGTTCRIHRGSSYLMEKKRHQASRSRRADRGNNPATDGLETMPEASAQSPVEAGGISGLYTGILALFSSSSLYP